MSKDELGKNGYYYLGVTIRAISSQVDYRWVGMSPYCRRPDQFCVFENAFGSGIYARHQAESAPIWSLAGKSVGIKLQNESGDVLTPSPLS
jgi:hypothetical protein